MSDFEILARVIAVLAAALATLKGGYELLMHSRGRLRDEYRFAKEFLADLQNAPSMHPFLREKGLQALAGTDGLSAREVEYLLKLPEPAVSLKDYVAAKAFLHHRATATPSEISFAPAWQAAWKRTFWKTTGLIAYVALFALAMSPLFLPMFAGGGLGSLKLLFLTVPTFGFLAFLALVQAVRIARADRVLGRQLSVFA
ncbi:MAG: hypothetical protein JWQ07_106 [Ramlibacter sp.]|nr:hypothetical protein [Ramlibacter sp.]